jgi:hypothetical protein
LEKEEPFLNSVLPNRQEEGRPGCPAKENSTLYVNLLPEKVSMGTTPLSEPTERLVTLAISV